MVYHLARLINLEQGKVVCVDVQGAEKDEPCIILSFASVIFDLLAPQAEWVRLCTDLSVSVLVQRNAEVIPHPGRFVN